MDSDDDTGRTDVDGTMFEMDDGDGVHVNAAAEQLDELMSDTLAFVTRVYERDGEASAEANHVWLPGTGSLTSDARFPAIWGTFESSVLPCTGTHHVQFLLFLATSRRTDHCESALSRCPSVPPLS